MKKQKAWEEHCVKCGRKHLWRIGLCPTCGVHEVPRLVSKNACYHDESCDGCIAYREHCQ